jgi:hypothetical protein
LILEELTKEELDDVVDRMPNGVSGLLAAFFTRETRDGAVRDGAEFTHKSFAEYLYARCLARQVARLVAKPIGRNNQQKADDTHNRLAEFVRIVAGHRMTVDLLNWLKPELRAAAGTDRVHWHESLTPLLEDLARDGWAEHPAATTQRRAEGRTANAEEALFCIWQTLWQPSERPVENMNQEEEESAQEGRQQYWQFPHIGVRGVQSLRHRLEAVYSIGREVLKTSARIGCDLVRRSAAPQS